MPTKSHPLRYKIPAEPLPYITLPKIPRAPSSYLQRTTPLRNPVLTDLTTLILLRRICLESPKSSTDLFSPLLHQPNLSSYLGFFSPDYFTLPPPESPIPYSFLPSSPIILPAPANLPDLSPPSLSSPIPSLPESHSRPIINQLISRTRPYTREDTAPSPYGKPTHPAAPLLFYAETTTYRTLSNNLSSISNFAHNLHHSLFPPTSSNLPSRIKRNSRISPSDFLPLLDYLLDYEELLSSEFDSPHGMNARHYATPIRGYFLAVPYYEPIQLSTTPTIHPTSFTVVPLILSTSTKKKISPLWRVPSTAFTTTPLSKDPATRNLHFTHSLVPMSYTPHSCAALQLYTGFNPTYQYSFEFFFRFLYTRTTPSVRNQLHHLFRGYHEINKPSIS